MLVDERIAKQQTDPVFNICSHQFNVICREVLPAHERRDDLNYDSRALPLDSEGLDVRRRFAGWAKSVIRENGAPDGLQGRRQVGGVQDARVDGVGEESMDGTFVSGGTFLFVSVCLGADVVLREDM